MEANTTEVVAVPTREQNSPAELRGMISQIRWHCPEGSGRVIAEVTPDTSPAGGSPADGSPVTVSVLGRLDFVGVPSAWIGREVHVVGRWRQHETRGWQIHADGIVRAEPRTERGVVKFMREVLGVSDSLARRIWTRFRERAPEIVRTDPAAVIAAGLADADLAHTFSRTLARLARYQETFLSLSTLFAGRRMPLGLSSTCIDRWGHAAPAIIRRDPYLLMTLPGYVVGFTRADSMFLEFGGDPHRLKRQTLFLAHAIVTNRAGHTWMRAEDLRTELAAELGRRGGAKPRTGEAIKLGLRAGLLARHRDQSGELWITTRGMDRDEADVAAVSRRLLTLYSPIGSMFSIDSVTATEANHVA